MRVAFALMFGLFFTLGAQADEFRYEANGSYVSEDADFGDNDTLRLAGRYYFNSITDDDGPLAEAAFLRPASNIGVAYSDTNRTLAPPMPIAINPAVNVDYAVVSPGGVFQPLVSTLPAGPGPSVDTRSFAGRYEFVSPARWLASVQIGREDGDAQSMFTSSDIEDTSYAFEVGKYLNATTTVSLGLSYITANQKLTAPIFNCSVFVACTVAPGPELNSSSRQRQWQARARHLRPVGEMHVAIEGAARYGVATLSTDTDSPTTIFPPELQRLQSPRIDRYGINLAATIYPRANLGIGLSFDHDDAEGLSTNSVALDAQWFVSRSIELSARLGRSSGDINRFVDNDVDSLGVGLLARF